MESENRKIRKIRKIPVPAWLFVMAMTVALEALVHIWVADTFVWGRFLAIITFGAGFGGLLGLLVNLIPSEKVQKWTTVAVSLALVVLYLTEYFIEDAYQTYMPMISVISGAGGVATGFGDVVVTLLGRNLLRIGMLLLPIALYALYAQPLPLSWKNRGILAGAAAGCYLLGVIFVNTLTVDAAKFTTAYNFDSGVRSLGLNMSMMLDAFHRSAPSEEEPGFVVIETPETEAPSETAPLATEETQPQEIVYGENVMDIDFAALAEEKGNAAIKSLHSYVSTVQPTKKNAYTGLFAGKNLIFITAEAFTSEVVREDLTPTLYRLANEGIKFTDYYQPAWGASTTTGEFSNLVGMVPVNGAVCMFEPYQQNLFHLLGRQLQALGYSSAAYHNNDHEFYSRNDTHVHLGYDKFVGYGNGLEAGITSQWPESDLEMVDFTLPEHLENTPFSLYYMSVSGHSRYDLPGNAMSRKHFDKVDHLPYSEAVKCYLACNLEFEYAMESMLRQLEEAGILEDTVIVIAPDHYPYGLERSSTWGNNQDCLAELYGRLVTDRFVREHSQLIIWSPVLEDMDLQVDTPVYSLDILPTVSNLFGFEFDSRLMVGRDVFSDAQPLVLWPDHSWKTDKGMLDTDTGIFTPAEGVRVDEDYVRRISDLVANKITYSYAVQNNDYFDFLTDVIGK